MESKENIEKVLSALEKAEGYMTLTEDFSGKTRLQGHTAARIWYTDSHNGVRVAKKHDAIWLCNEVP